MYEVGEVDGPGFGGCPAGPEGQPPVPPTSVQAVRAEDRVTLTWTTPEQRADAPAVSQYRVAVIDTVTGQEIAVRQGANATGEHSAAIHGLNADQAYPLILEATNGRWSPVVELGTLNADGSITPAGQRHQPDHRLRDRRHGSGSHGRVGGADLHRHGPATATSGTVTGLSNNTDYTIQVFAVAGEQRTRSTTATGVNARAKPNDVVTVTRAEYRADRREYRIQGTAADATTSRVHVRTSSGATIQLNVQVLADGT